MIHYNYNNYYYSNLSIFHHIRFIVILLAVISSIRIIPPVHTFHILSTTPIRQQSKFRQDFTVSRYVTTRVHYHHYQQQQKSIILLRSNKLNQRYHTILYTVLPNTNSDSTVTTSSSSTSSTSSPTTNSKMKLISGLNEIIDKYDVFILDMWGVLHDGKQPYEYVLETIQQMKSYNNNDDNNNKTIIILSNSSKRYHHSIQNLQQLGFHCNDFHSIITSGEVTYQMLLSSSRNNDETSTTTKSTIIWDELQQSIIRSKNNQYHVYIFGSGDDDIQYCKRCGWIPVSNIENATVLLARGPFTIPILNSDDNNNNIEYNVIDRRIDGDTIYEQTLQTVLHIAAQKYIPMIVSNPDKVRPDANRSPMPGQIGDLYESILNEYIINDKSSSSSLVKRIGKPFSDVYTIAMQDIKQSNTNILNDINMERVCMVGDALETDVVGGMKFGIDTIWVLKNGVHNIDIQNYVQSNNNNHDENENLFQSANLVLQQFNQNNTGTYAEGYQLSPTYVIPYFKW